MAISRRRRIERTYSVAEARNHLAGLVHKAEAGEAIEITRRGRPVAVLLSHGAYRELTAERRSLWEVVERFRSEHDMVALAIDPDEVWGGARSAEPGREFSW